MLALEKRRSLNDLIHALDRKFAWSFFGVVLALLFGGITIQREFFADSSPRLRYDILTSTAVLDLREDVSKLNKTQLARVRNRKIGFVFQSYNLLSRTSALKNVMLPLLYNSNGPQRQSTAEREALAMEALEALRALSVLF